MTLARILIVLALFCVTPAHADTRVCFTPGEDCAGLIAAELNGAKATVLVQAYSFTSAPIAKALVDAHNRGVDVRVILDKSQRTERYSSLTFLRNAEIPVWIDDRVAIAHNKVMVIDGATVVTGSFNFTKAAQERNAENVLIIHDRNLAARYTANWQARAAVSTPVE
ncbi:MAG: phospholipase D family nuclease [Alphaproteobacteria bacterium]